MEKQKCPLVESQVSRSLVLRVQKTDSPSPPPTSLEGDNNKYTDINVFFLSLQYKAMVTMPLVSGGVLPEDIPI